MGSAALGRIDAGGRWISWAFSLAFAVLYSAFCLVRYNRFLSWSWDLSIFTQAVSGYAHLAAPISTVKGPGFNVLGDHFSPIIALLAPAYRLVPDPRTLLVAQALLFAASVWPITRLGVERLGRVRGSLIGAAYGLSWGLQSALVVDFHEIAFAVPLLAFALTSLVRRRWWATVAWSVPLVFTKEDLGLTVAAIGLVMAWRGARGIGLGLATFGVLSTALEMFVLIPWVGGTYAYADRVDANLSPNALVTVDKVTTLLLVFGVTALLALRSPLTFIALPTLGWRFLADKAAYWGEGWHYNAVLMPIVFVALLDALFQAEETQRTWVRRWSAAASGAVAAVALLLLPLMGLWSLTNPDRWQSDVDVAAAEQAVSIVPEGAVVASNIGLMAHLVPGRTVYWLDGESIPTPDYVAIDTREGWPSQIAEDKALQFANERYQPATYRIIFQGVNYLVLQKND